MKLIAVFMVILISFCPIAASRENSGRTASSLRLVSEAASAGRIQKTQEDLTAVESEKEPGTIMIQEENDELETVAEKQPALAPVHEHSWEPVIVTVHHDPVYQIIHHEAQTEKVWIEDTPAYDETYENTYLVGMHDICKGCGMDITASGMSYEEYDAHDRQHILNGEDSSYFSQPVYETVMETIHHEAEGHYEEIVVCETYSDTILVSEAWDEEVVTGYVCEECGEIQ